MNAVAPTPPLALVEVLERDGRVRSRFVVTHWPVRIGRALDCDVVLDDPHVAPLHATLSAAEGEPAQLQVGDTVNGVRVLAGPPARRGAAQQLLKAGALWTVPADGAQLRLGDVMLRLRWPGEVLAPELPLQAHRRVWLTVLCALLIWGSAVLERALGFDPGAAWSEWLAPVLGPPVALGIWCLLWGLASRLVQQRFDVMAHGALAVRVLATGFAIDWVFPTVAFAASWTWLVQIIPTLILCGAAYLLWGHCVIVQPARRRGLTVLAVALLLAVGGYHGAQNLQRLDRWFGVQRVSWLGPPALRLAPAVPVQAFTDATARLQGVLEQRVAEDAKERRDGERDDVPNEEP